LVDKIFKKKVSEQHLFVFGLDKYLEDSFISGRDKRKEG